MSDAIALLQPGWADWEAGYVLSSLRRNGGRRIILASPDGGEVQSIGGVTAKVDLGFDDVSPASGSVLLLIGSDDWLEFHNDQLFEMLRNALAANCLVGAICAGTVAAARAGLFEGRAHTSNGTDFLAGHAPGYAGHERYADVPGAVTDGNLISASGLAALTFAAAVLRLAVPETPHLADKYLAAYGREMRDVSTD